ncbi:MAG: DNA-3-methyladenine glycosylase family protein [Dehalococcoidia bacterium]
MATLKTELKPVPPFDFHLTADYRTRFRQDLASEVHRDGIYRRVCTVRDNLALMSVSSTGTIERPRLEMETTGQGLVQDDLSSLRNEAVAVLGLDYDLSGFYTMSKDDHLLSRLIDSFYGLKPTTEPDVFETLVSAIIGQQISAKVAVTMERGLIQSYGEPFFWDGSTYYRFPRPEKLAAVGIDELRRHKLSQRKAEYIHGLAKAVSEGSVDLEALKEMSNESVIRELVQLRGIGEWTAQWVLCNSLGRFEVFPSGDLALLRMLSRVYLDGQAVTPQEAEAFAERWGPYRVPVIVYSYAAIRQGIDLSA